LQTKEQYIGYKTCMAVLRAAHVATPMGQGGSGLDVEFQSRGGTYGLERRLQPAPRPSGP
ncbi:MAG: hypothetical protein OXU35_03895, partial [Acidobacteriota bacterium]|nr:hypothetical protein [Acidobacteriota bacterium]